MVTETDSFEMKAPVAKSNQTEPSGEMRVLQVMNALGVGGGETWIMALLRHFRDQRRDGRPAVQFDLLLTQGEKSVFDDEAVALGARLHYLRFSRGTIGSFARRFRRLLRQGNYHAIHDHHDFVAGWHFLMGGGILPDARVVHLHNPVLHIDANYALSPVRKLTYRLGRRLVAKYATCIAGTSLEVLGEYGYDRPEFRNVPKLAAHCGFDCRRFVGNHEEVHNDICREFGFSQAARIVLFAGRLDRSMDFVHPTNHKNSAFALEVVRQACAIDTDLHLLMAGAGDLSRKLLEEKIAGWGLANRLRIIGVRSDIPRLMLGSDAFLFPSRQEGLGMVAVEAQAAGLPVLTSTCVPRECVVVPSMVDFKSLDEPISDWAALLVQIVRRPRRRENECNNAVRQSPFSIENSADRLLYLYKNRGVQNELLPRTKA